MRWADEVCIENDRVAANGICSSYSRLPASPDRKMCLSAELLSRGLVRLDMADQGVLREFPELVAAALSAVESKEGLAAVWADDNAEYVTQLRTLNRVLAG